MITSAIKPPPVGELGDEWQREGSAFHQHPSNHRLAPGGREYWTRPQTSVVLDVGCNCGQLAKNLRADLDCDVWGIDMVPDFIEICKTSREAQAGSLDADHFFVADFGAMAPHELRERGRAGTFDVVTALEVIEHPLDLAGFRRNVALALKPRGRLIITTPHADHPLYGRSYFESNPHHVIIWTRESLTAFFGPFDVYAELWDQTGGPHIAAAWTVDEARGMAWATS